MIESALRSIPQEVKEKPFPKLMKGKLRGTIVLMTESRCGTVVNGDELGTHSRTWHMDKFTDYDGPVTLRNAQ